MKLNLLPTYVSKEKQAKTAWVLSSLLALASVAAAVGMVIFSRQILDKNKAMDEALQGDYDRVKALAAKADTIIATAQPIILNTNLAQAMIAHNDVYPDLFDEVRQYIPPYFRLQSMAAVPNGPDSSTVTLQGVIQTQQQYADLMLSLLRIPGATSVSRDGYAIVSPRVPALSEIDQFGRPLRPGEGPVPTDPEERLAYYIGQGAITGFENAPGFGTGEPGLRGAMPDWSQVTVSVVIPKNIQTPDPRATLTSGGGGGQAPAPTAPASPGPRKGGGGGL